MKHQPQKNMYSAQIGNKKLRVDINNLPYGKFNAQTPLVIMEKVIIKEPLSTRVSFENVKFNGGIDIPQQTISNSDDTLIVKAHNISVNEYLKKPFARHNMTLVFDALDYDAEKTVAKQTVEEPVVVQQNRETDRVVQTKDFANAREIYNICANNPIIKSYALSESELKKEIRKLMNALNKQKMFSPQINDFVYCIAASNIPELVKKIQSNLQKTGCKTIQAEPINPATTPKPTKQPLSQERIAMHPVKIKKYISQRLWKEISKACGKNIAAMKNILEIIAAINTEISQTKPSCHLQIIDPKTMAITTSSYLRRKSENCVIQSTNVSLRKDNKRIVWSYIPNEHILVCTGFFIEHTKTKSGNSYEKCCEFASAGKNDCGENITLAKITPEEYFDVDTLLEKYDAKTQTPQQTNTEIRSGKAPNIRTINIVEERINSQHINLQHNTKEKIEIVPILVEKPQNLPDVIAAQKHLESIINLINKTIKDHIQNISAEEDTQKQIKQIDLIRAALIKKQTIQNALSEMSDLDSLLTQIKTINQR